jgi:hypothetical protein
VKSSLLRIGPLGKPAEPARGFHTNRKRNTQCQHETFSGNPQLPAAIFTGGSPSSLSDPCPQAFATPPRRSAPTAPARRRTHALRLPTNSRTHGTGDLSYGGPGAPPRGAGAAPTWRGPRPPAQPHPPARGRGHRSGGSWPFEGR